MQVLYTLFVFPKPGVCMFVCLSAYVSKQIYKIQKMNEAVYQTISVMVYKGVVAQL